MTWTVRVRDIRRHAGGLRWTLIAATPDLETLLYVDTLESGTVFDMQSDEYSGTSGDAELDDLARECISRSLATRHAAQSLDALERTRWGRVQGPADRARWAA
jgi:hypothetical protein